jgi:glycine/D-amino acid oxidase-like deaminating enzyme
LKGADVLVIGAGCVGANVAYRLAEGGAVVTVLDAGAPGGGTSGASFAWTNSFGKTPRDYHDLNVAGMEEHAALSKKLGGGWLHQDGALAWEETSAGLARLGQAMERLAGWGYPVERISPGHARELEPALRIADAVPHVVWTPGEGYVEVAPFVAALLAAAARSGARILPGRRVTGIIRSGDRAEAGQLAPPHGLCLWDVSYDQ